jgi:hypothetical protein
VLAAAERIYRFVCGEETVEEVERREPKKERVPRTAANRAGSSTDSGY